MLRPLLLGCMHALNALQAPLAHVLPLLLLHAVYLQGSPFTLDTACFACFWALRHQKVRSSDFS